MKSSLRWALVLLSAAAGSLHAQPSVTGPMPAPEVVSDAGLRRTAYEKRIDEVMQWEASQAKPGESYSREVIIGKLARREKDPLISQGVIAMMKDPSSGPFWMFPAVCIAFLGRGQLSPQANQAMREMWRTTYQIRGDTENHWAMYYSSLFLMSEFYPDLPASGWYNGKSSAENRAEAKSYLIHWMDLTSTIGQGEFNPTGYIAEYTIPMMYLAAWAKDPEMKQRGHMMLDWLFSELAENSLHGMLRGANARTDERDVIERWNAITSYYNWLLFGDTVPTASYGGFGMFFAAAAKSYTVPEVMYRIAVDERPDYLARDLKRTRRRWRLSDQLMPPVYKTSYMRKDYAVGSYQGGLADPIQTHVWDVTWNVADPRGVHNTMFSLQPYSSNDSMQTYFSTLPEPMIPDLAVQGKPSYDLPDKIVGSSPYEQVFQDLDTIVALYDIKPGTRFPQINGFFSKDLVHLTEAKSGWIFAQGGQTYLAYRPLAAYRWIPYLHRDGGWAKDVKNLGGKLLISEHLKNGTIVQAASASEFPSFAAFQRAIEALPLEFKLEPAPSVQLTTLRGRRISFTYGQTPVVDGHPIDYGKWKLFESPYLNAEKGSRKLTITYGRLQRVLDFNTLTISDTVTPE